MGTSTAYGGPKGGTPLIPSWLDDGGGGGPADGAPPADGANGNQDNDAPPNDATSPTPPNRPPMPADGEPQRFTSARNNFSRFARSGGSDRASLGRAVSQYVSHSSGGSSRAAQRMGTSRSAGGRLLGFLADAQTRGIEQALRSINLGELAGRPILEVFLGLTDYICPDAGTVDEGIAREAYIETIVDLTSDGVTDLSTFSPEQVDTFFELFATHAIEARICNDIGTKAVTMPSDAHTAHLVETQLRDFIQGGVRDALSRARAENPNLTAERIHSFVDKVYETAFQVLHALGEAETDL